MKLFVKNFFIFLKNFFKFLSSSSATSDIIPYTYFLVNNFFYFFEKNFKKIKNRAKQPHFTKKFNFFIFSFYNANPKLTKPFYLLIYKAFLLFSFIFFFILISTIEQPLYHLFFLYIIHFLY